MYIAHMHSVNLRMKCSYVTYVAICTLIFYYSYIILFLEYNISLNLDINEDEVTIKFTHFDGQVKYKLDDAPYETCM